MFNAIIQVLKKIFEDEHQKLTLAKPQIAVQKLIR